MRDRHTSLCAYTRDRLRIHAIYPKKGRVRAGAEATKGRDKIPTYATRLSADSHSLPVASGSDSYADVTSRSNSFACSAPPPLAFSWPPPFRHPAESVCVGAWVRVCGCVHACRLSRRKREDAQNHNCNHTHGHARIVPGGAGGRNTETQLQPQTHINLYTHTALIRRREERINATTHTHTHTHMNCT